MKTLEEIFGAELVNVELFVKNSIRTICKNWNKLDKISDNRSYYTETVNGIEFDCINNSWGYKHTIANTHVNFDYIYNGYKYKLYYYRNKLTLKDLHCLDESVYKVVKTSFADGQIIDDFYEIYIENGVKKIKVVDGCESTYGVICPIETNEYYYEENMIHYQYEWFQHGGPVGGTNYYSDGTKKHFYLD